MLLVKVWYQLNIVHLLRCFCLEISKKNQLCQIKSREQHWSKGGSLELGKIKQDEVLSKYMKKLQSSGYDSKTRLEILKSIKNGWNLIINKSHNGERPLLRSRGYMKEERKEGKRNKKINWYKGKDKKSFD